VFRYTPASDSALTACRDTDAHGHERSNDSGCGLYYSISMTGSGVQLGQGPQAYSR
jgi:hypothetical protein